MSGALDMASSGLNMIGGTTGALLGGLGGGSLIGGALGGLGSLGNMFGSGQAGSQPMAGQDPFVMENLKNAQGQLNQQYSNVGNLAPQIQQQYGNFGNMANQYGGLGQQYGQLGQQYGNLFNQVGGNQNAYLQAGLTPQLQANAQMYGNIMQDQGQRGIRGSSFGDQTLGNFQNQANTAIGNQTAQLLNQSYGQQGNMLQGMQGSLAGMGNALGGQSNMYGNQLGALSQQQGLYGQQGNIANSIAGLGNAQAQNQANLINANTGTYNANIKNSGQNAGMFGGLMNGVSSLMGGGSGLGSLFGGGGADATTMMLQSEGFSDKRLKTNIERIGTHKLGIGLYKWDYIWGEPAIGVMADEVLEVRPEAVSIKHGYQYVNYSMLG